MIGIGDMLEIVRQLPEFGLVGLYLEVVAVKSLVIFHIPS
jgi:hypothetical protein